MTNRFRTLDAAILLVAAVLLGACGETADIGAEKAAIQKVSDAWLQNIGERNAAAIAASFTSDGVVLNVGASPVSGPIAIEANIESNWAVNPDFTIDWQTQELSVSESVDMAWERGQWTFDADGDGPANASNGEYITVFEKIGGEWKVAVDIGVPTAAD